jgi:hypothetical protein
MRNWPTIGSVIIRAPQVLMTCNCQQPEGLISGRSGQPVTR